VLLKASFPPRCPNCLPLVLGVVGPEGLCSKIKLSTTHHHHHRRRRQRQRHHHHHQLIQLFLKVFIVARVIFKKGTLRQALVSWVLFEGSLVRSVTRWPLREWEEKCRQKWNIPFSAPPSVGGLDLDSRSSGCARLGGGVGPPLGVVVEPFSTLCMVERYCPGRGLLGEGRGPGGGAAPGGVFEERATCAITQKRRCCIGNKKVRLFNKSKLPYYIYMVYTVYSHWTCLSSIPYI